ncbi:MAG: NlpC/P60 family protein [Pseudomonadota bacterium]
MSAVGGDRVKTRVVEEARAWIGTPYRHQASRRGVGADCLGLVRGVWRSLYGAEPAPVPDYTADWAGRVGNEPLLEAAARNFTSVEPVAAQPGDLLVFRPFANGPAKHCAVMSAPGRMIHAVHGRCVCETVFARWWERRTAGVFSFPEFPHSKDGRT